MVLGDEEDEDIAAVVGSTRVGSGLLEEGLPVTMISGLELDVAADSLPVG